MSPFALNNNNKKFIESSTPSSGPLFSFHSNTGMHTIWHSTVDQTGSPTTEFPEDEGNVGMDVLLLFRDSQAVKCLSFSDGAETSREEADKALGSTRNRSKRRLMQQREEHASRFLGQVDDDDAECELWRCGIARYVGMFAFLLWGSVLCFASWDECSQGVCCVVVTSAVQFWLVLPGH